MVRLNALRIFVFSSKWATTIVRNSDSFSFLAHSWSCATTETWRCKRLHTSFHGSKSLYEFSCSGNLQIWEDVLEDLVLYDSNLAGTTSGCNSTPLQSLDVDDSHGRDRAKGNIVSALCMWASFVGD